MSRKKFLFGPVASRRLGRSLGVDIVPLKTCTQNCVYCQLGIDAEQTLERRSYVPVSEVLEELRGRIEGGLDADYITISGSGEPTLNSEIGVLIDGIRRLSDIPVAVITNGTLLSDPGVRVDCGKADVVLPSLDAGDEVTFSRINCPHGDINFQSFVEGLCRFRSEYSGQIWLEVFFSEGVNTSDSQISRIKAMIGLIGPDKVQLNTAVRPTVDSSVEMVSAEKLEMISEILGCNAEVIADFSRGRSESGDDVGDDAVLEMLRRRPCSLGDVCSGLGIKRGKAEVLLEGLKDSGAVVCEDRDGQQYYRAK